MFRRLIYNKKFSAIKPHHRQYVTVILQFKIFLPRNLTAPPTSYKSPIPNPHLWCGPLLQPTTRAILFLLWFRNENTHYSTHILQRIAHLISAVNDLICQKFQILRNKANLPLQNFSILKLPYLKAMNREAGFWREGICDDLRSCESCVFWIFKIVHFK